MMHPRLFERHSFMHWIERLISFLLYPLYRLYILLLPRDFYWNADPYLTMVIRDVLYEFRRRYEKDYDPETMASQTMTNMPFPTEKEMDEDFNMKDVLDEIIWACDKVSDDHSGGLKRKGIGFNEKGIYSKEQEEKDRERMENAFILLGKYIRFFWT